MRFTVEVGEMEKHLVEYNFNQLQGKLVIRVDDQPVVKATRVFNEPVHEVYQFVIDGMEKSAVRIEKRRKPLFGHSNLVYVNDRLTRVVDRLF
jgi:Fas apoptotic inhibitory molecule (FAIM1)